jgi:hypothetical protein
LFPVREHGFHARQPCRCAARAHLPCIGGPKEARRAGDGILSEARRIRKTYSARRKETMNRNIASILLVSAAAFGVNAYADDITIDNTPFQGQRTQAEVQAELAQYKAAGVNPWSTQYNPLKQFRSVRSRADVVAEFAASRAEVAALTGEDSGSGYLAQAGSRTGVSATLAGQPRNAQ